MWLSVLLIFIQALATQATLNCNGFLPSLQNCNSKCCKGKCQQGSCVANGFYPYGRETQCVYVKRKYRNEGSGCPWAFKSYAIKCSTNPSCKCNKGHFCYGTTVCAKGACPKNTLGLFCIKNRPCTSFKVCACAIDCQVGGWSEWSTCMNGTQLHNRTIMQPKAGFGKDCGALFEERTCVPNIDCQVSGWSDWQQCINNTQVKQRTILQNQSGNGLACPMLILSRSCGDKCQDIVKTRADFYVISFNKSVSGNVVKNDQGVVNISVVNPPTRGNLSVYANGSFTYTPKQGFCGMDEFNYNAYNGACYSNEAVVLTTTCGCGKVFALVNCKLQNTNITTCTLPGGKFVEVISNQSYASVDLQLSAKINYLKE